LQQHHNHHRRPLRAGFAVALSAAAVLSLGLLGGVGFAKSSVSASQYQYGPKGKTTICHKGKTITVSNAALPAHKKHGDTVGPCAKDKRKGKNKAEDHKAKPHSGATEQQPAVGTPADKGKHDDKGEKDDKDKGKAPGSGKSSDDSGHQAAANAPQPPAAAEHGKSGDDHGKPDDKGGKPEDKGGNGKGK